MTETNSDGMQRLLGEARVMAILRGLGSERSLELSERAWSLGIHVVELPLQSADDVEALRLVSARAAEEGYAVGAGTIVCPEQVAAAQAAGAAFVVSPGLDPDVVREAGVHGIPVLPGVASPSEVQRAVRLGLTWLKAFPAAWLGPEWFTLMRGPFPQVSFVATGGLNAENADTFLSAGVRVVAIGSALEDEEQLDRLSALTAGRQDGNG